MKVDGGVALDLVKSAESAKEAEAAGYSGAWTAETNHDPFFPLLLAAEHTQRIELGTSIAVAFARNPMTLANIGWDLQSYSKGRFILGLGSQIKPHITKRFSMEWSHPAARMREMIMAIRAIWDTWENGTPLNFRGDFYTHTLMTPFFTPDRADLAGFGTPKIFLAGVGELMTEVAGEVCDGFICHGFTTEKYLREVTLLALERGRAKAGKTMEGFEVVGPSFIVTGNTEPEMQQAAAGTRQQIAFYGSTPAYRGVLDIHGWGGLQEELNSLSKQGQWVEMGNLINDEILNTFAVVGSPEQVAPELKRRYDDVIQRISFYAPYKSDPERWRRVFSALPSWVDRGLGRARRTRISVELGCRAQRTLEFGHARRGCNGFDCVPQFQRLVAPRNLRDDGSEETAFVGCAGTERENRRADTLACTRKCEIRLFAQDRIEVFVVGAVCPVGIETCTREHVDEEEGRVVEEAVALAVVVQRGADGGVQGADRLVAGLFARICRCTKDATACSVGGTPRFAVGAVADFFVDHPQRNEPPSDVVIALCAHLFDPTGRDPRPRAHRVEKELEVTHE